MTLDQLIKPDRVLCNAHARSKKHCLEILSELLSSTTPEISSDEIFSKLVERERLGCTCMDRGTAFPHCRIEGVSESCGALVKLSSPIDFDSTDGEPVDLLFGLMVPAAMNEGHYGDTRMITGLLSDASLRDSLRAATSSRDLYQALITSGMRSQSEMPDVPQEL
jgi:PTS system nitrogen regulatory IIA component